MSIVVLFIKMKPFLAKRKHQRTTIDAIAVLIPTPNRDKTPIDCRICDISEGGIKVIAERQLGQEKYNIIMANQKFPLRVVYSETLSDHEYLCGLQFVNQLSPLLKQEIIRNLDKTRKKTGKKEKIETQEPTPE